MNSWISFKGIADIPHLFFLSQSQQKSLNLRFLHGFSTDFAHFFTEIMRKNSPS